MTHKLNDINISKNKIYSRNELFQLLKEQNPDMNESTFRWKLYHMQLEKEIYRTGYNTYSKQQREELCEYHSCYTEQAKEMQAYLENKFRDLSFVLFESVQLNEFLNHQIAQNTLYVQVEKDMSSYVFDEMRGDFNMPILYKPNGKEFERYWVKDCIVVLELISQAPQSQQFPHEMTGEKLLVDILADKSIAMTFSPAELPFIYENFMESYRIDRRRLNRYAGRRGKTEEVNRYMEPRHAV